MSLRIKLDAKALLGGSTPKVSETEDVQFETADELLNFVERKYDETWTKEIEDELAALPPSERDARLQEHLAECRRLRAAKVREIEDYDKKLALMDRRIRGLHDYAKYFKESRPEALLRVRDWLLSEIKDFAKASLVQSAPGESLNDEGFDATIGQASVTIWDNDIWKASQRGREAFAGVPFKRPIDGFEGGPFQLWINTDTQFGREADDYILARLVMCRDEGLVVVDVKFSGTFSLEEGYFRIDWGIVQDFAEPICPEYAGVLAGLSFMGMEWVGPERQRFPHHLRRAAEMGRRPPLPEVSIIRLRRTYRDDRRATESDGNREYSCQWMVGGHWRRQWYSSKGEWKQIYISPYVKGPADKPFRSGQGTVYVVSR